jgi:hypothetical protein
METCLCNEPGEGFGDQPQQVRFGTHCAKNAMGAPASGPRRQPQSSAAKRR